MLAVEKTGRGIPLVFLHAFPLSKKMWDTHRVVFSKHFQCITVDFPGFGASPSIGETLHMDAMAEALNKALDHNGINEKIVLTGVSMGGYVAFRFAATFAHRLRSLILVATKPTPDPEATRQKRAENIAIIQKDGLTPFAERMITSLLGKTSQEKSPDVVERVRGWILENDPQAVCAALRGMAARPNSSDILSKLNVPVCVMAGEEDTVIPVTEIKAMADQIKKADFQALSGCGHLLPIERPAEFQSAFLNYLKRRVL